MKLQNHADLQQKKVIFSEKRAQIAIFGKIRKIFHLPRQPPLQGFPQGSIISK